LTQQIQALKEEGRLDGFHNDAAPPALAFGTGEPTRSEAILDRIGANGLVLCPSRNTHSPTSIFRNQSGVHRPVVRVF